MQGVPFSARKQAMDAAACTWTATGEMVCQKEPLDSVDVMESYAKGLFFPSPSWKKGWDRTDPADEEEDKGIKTRKSMPPPSAAKPLGSSRMAYSARSRPIPTASSSAAASASKDKKKEGGGKRKDEKTMLEAFWDERMKMGGEDDLEDEEEEQQVAKGRETYTNNKTKKSSLASRFYDDEDDFDSFAIKKEGFVGSSKNKKDREEDVEDYDYDEPFFSAKDKKKKETFSTGKHRKGLSYFDDEDEDEEDEDAYLTEKFEEGRKKGDDFEDFSQKKGKKGYDIEDFSQKKGRTIDDDSDIEAFAVKRGSKVQSGTKFDDEFDDEEEEEAFSAKKSKMTGKNKKRVETFVEDEDKEELSDGDDEEDIEDE